MRQGSPESETDFRNQLQKRASSGHARREVEEFFVGPHPVGVVLNARDIRELLLVDSVPMDSLQAEGPSRSLRRG